MGVWYKEFEEEELQRRIRGLRYNSCFLLKLTLAFIALHCIAELTTELIKQ
jgi:hypothetical protein